MPAMSSLPLGRVHRREQDQNTPPWKSTIKATANNLSPAFCATGNQNILPWKSTRKVTAMNLSPACTTENQNIPPWKRSINVTAKSLSPTCAPGNQNIPPWKSTRKVTTKSLSPTYAVENQNIPPWKSTRKVAAKPKSLSPACISDCATGNQNRSRWKTTGKVTENNLSSARVSIRATVNPSHNSGRKRTPLGQSNFLQSENNISAQKQSFFTAAAAESRAYEDELRELSSLQPVSSICASFLCEKLPAVSKPPDEMSNIKVSSLIQMWREIEAGAGLSPRSAHHKNINMSSSISSQALTDNSHNSFMVEQEPKESVALNMADEEQTVWESEKVINPREPSLPPSSISGECGSDEGDEVETRERFESESVYVGDAEMQINGWGVEIPAVEDSFSQNKMEQEDRYVPSQLSQSNPHQKIIKPIEEVDDMEDEVVSYFKEKTIKPIEEVVCTSLCLQQRHQTTRRQLAFDDIWLERHSDDKALLNLLDRRTVSKALTGDFGQKIDHILSSFLEQQRQESVEYESAQDHISEGDQDPEVGSVDSFAPTPTKLPPTHGCHHYQEGNQEERQIYGHMHSNEMQLIYEMKGDIVRLKEEIRELKKSIQSCVELQMKMQHFAKPEDNFPVLKSSEIEPLEKLQDVHKSTSRGICCICYRMEVDSFLNRYM